MRDFRFNDLLTSYRGRVVHLGWTQKKVAKELGVEERTYQNWELGFNLPKRDMLPLIARLFELTDTEADDLYRAAAQTGPEIHNLPFQPNPYFTGREKYLELLDQHFKQNQSVAVSGLGGIGKTQLALTYAHRSYRTVYRTILWVDATRQATLETSYLALARLLQLPKKNEREIDHMVQAVKKWLEDYSYWLLILDNADDLELARSFLPTKPRGHVLFTTRSQIVGVIAKQIEVKVMEPEEGVSFLLLRSKYGTEADALLPSAREAANRLAVLLGELPLALDQAGAYIEEAGISFDDYIQKYHQQRSLLLNRYGPLDTKHPEHPETVFVTFEICLQGARELCPEAVEVLRFCSFLHPEDIPEEVFSLDTRLGLNPLLFDKAMAALWRYSLAKRNGEKKLLSVHRLVQAVLQDTLIAETKKRWIEQLITTMQQIFPNVANVQDKYADTSWRNLCERLITHVLVLIDHLSSWTSIPKDLASPLASLLYSVACYLHEQPRSTEAISFYQYMLSIWNPNDLPNIFFLQEALAWLYWTQGYYKKAESLFQDNMYLAGQTLGPDHPLLATTLHNLAALWTFQGKHKEAEQVFQRIQRIEEQSQLDRAKSKNNQAIAYKNQGRYEEAERYHQQALDIREKILNFDHPDVAVSLNGLANVYVEQGKYAKAEPLYQRALLIKEQHFGSNHHEIVSPMINLALLYTRQNKYEKAEPLYRRALSIWEQTGGSDHPNVARILCDLATVCLRQGKYAEAEQLCLRALSIHEQTYGPSDKITSQTRILHATIRISLSAEKGED